MNKYIKVRPALFFAGILLGIILLVYSFSATHFNSDTNSADRKNYGGAAGAGRELTLSAENEESADSKKSADNNEKRNALLAQKNDESHAASRGDIERYHQPVISSEQQAASPSGTDEEAPDMPASTETSAPAPSKTDAQPDRSVNAPAAAPATPVRTEAPAPAVSNTTAAKKAPAAEEAPAPAQAAQNVPAAAKPAAESEDLDLLARLITAEAQGEPFEAQVAVGAVVMNRVKSSDWPNTIKGVIYQKIGEYYQFTPVVNGWINKPAQPEAIEAAKAAMKGSDPTNGAQFYYDDKCTNEWILAKPVSLRVGHMIFAY